MDTIHGLEARIRSLETSRNRSRVAAWAFGLMLLFVSTGAMARQDATPPQEPTPAQEAQTIDALTTQRITLTGESGGSSIVLSAGPYSSLVIQTADGREITRIGGPAARHLR